MATDVFNSLKINYPALSNLTLKKEQVTCLDELLAGRHVFTMLPTGFGKSLVFTLFPLMKSELTGHHCVALVISPLRALMSEQVLKMEERGIKAVAVMQQCSSETSERIKSGDVDVVLASPESVLQPFWWELIKQLNLCLLAFDEAHCISTWGLDFRPDYRKVCEVVSDYPAVPTLLLSATATQDVQKDLYDLLALDDETTTVVAVVPDRPNIFIHWEKAVESHEKVLPWLAAYLKHHTEDSKKFILYCRTTRACMNIFFWLCDELGPDAFFDHQQKSDSRIVEMFHSHVDEDSKKRISANFVNGPLKLVVATVAFGMGVDIPDVDVVIHWGVESSALTYWQEMGRCGRDGRKALSLTYVFSSSQHLVPEEDPLHSLLSLPKSCCIRQKLLQQFNFDATHVPCKSGPTNVCDNSCEKCQCHLCSCCSSCCETCDCKGKVSFFDRL